MADDLKEIREVENRIKAIYARIGQEVPAKLLDNKSVEDANKSLSVARTLLSDLEGSASNLYDQLKGITSEFKGQRTSINESRSSLRKLTDISRELKLNEQGINELSSQQIKSLTRRYDVQKSIFDESQEARTNALLDNEDIKKQIDSYGGYVLESLELLEGISDEERALLYLRYSQEKPLEEIKNQLKEAAEFENKITSAIGLTGAAFENLNKIGVRAFGGLGINLGTLQEGFESANEAMRAQAIADMDKEMSSFAKRTNSLKAGLKALGPVLLDTFTDPLILAKGLADAFFDINKASVALSRETGQGIGNLDSFNTRAATTVDLMEVIVEASKETGLNIQNVFSADVLAGAAEFKRTMGGSAEESAGLLDLTAATGMTTDAILESTVETVNAFNGANKAAISQRGVMRDVLSASTAVKASLAGNPKALAEAAAAARRLGLSLQEVDSIADSLLDFESSINNELEAQLLTGRSINLAKARELALNNDLTGVSNEIFKNQVSVAEFSQMNRIQQEGLAKALGMNRDQLAKMAFQQAKLNGLTNEQAAAAAGVSLEEMQRVEIQENFQMALQKTLQVFEPILKIVGNFLSLPFVPQLLIWGTIAAKTFLPMVGYLGSAARAAKGFTLALFNPVKGIQTAWSSLTGLVTKAWTAIKAAWTGAAAAETASTAAKAGNTAATATQTAVESANTAAKTANTAAKAGNTAATATQTAVESANTAAKTANTAATTAQTAANTTMAASQSTIGTTGKAAGAGARAFGSGLKALGTSGAVAVPVLLSIAAVAASVGLAFLGIGAGIKMAAEGFVLLFSSLTLDQIKLLPVVALGFIALAGGLALLGPAGLAGLPTLITLIPVLAGLGFALKLAAPGIQAFGTVITSVFQGVGHLITTTAEAIQNLMSTLTLGQIGTLAAAALAFIALGTSLAYLGATGLLAIPVLMAVTPLLTGLSASGDAGEAEGKNTMAKVEEKLDKLIAVVEKGGNVYLDGNTVGTAQVLGTFKSA